jgi:hypothetical protein
MPALPWTTGPFNPKGNRELHVLTSTLPLTRYRDVPRFLRVAMQIRKQLATTDGCVGYGLDARLLKQDLLHTVSLARPRGHGRDPERLFQPTAGTRRAR